MIVHKKQSGGGARCTSQLSAALCLSLPPGSPILSKSHPREPAGPGPWADDQEFQQVSALAINCDQLYTASHFFLSAELAGSAGMSRHACGHTLQGMRTGALTSELDCQILSYSRERCPAGCKEAPLIEPAP